jgi:secreted PhoX family phosphatase
LTDVVGKPGKISRKAFLAGGAAGAAMLAFGQGGPLHALSAQAAEGRAPRRAVGYGPLVRSNGPDLLLPEGFSYRIISRQGQPMDDGNPTPGIFDGMGTFRGRRGTTILIRNHENRRRTGESEVIVPPELRYDDDPTYNAGDTKLVVDRAGNVVESFAILGGTDTNCAGGEMPWGAWVACEEVVNRGATGNKHGYVFEIDAYAEEAIEAVPIRSAGRFAHEAVAWVDGVLYLTEDRSLSQGGACFYRYLPTGEERDARAKRSSSRQRLTGTTGVLQALKLRDEDRADMDTGRRVGASYKVEWVTVPVPDHDDDTDQLTTGPDNLLPTRYQAQNRGAAVFDREEGMWVGGGKVYFDCTTGGPGDLGQVWEYDPRRERVTLVYQSADASVLENPDNMVIVPETGDLFLQEDSGGEQYVRGLTRDGAIYNFARTVTNDTEFCGGCFSPNGRTFFVNQQGERGGAAGDESGVQVAPAVTYAISGPFAARSRRERRPRRNGQGD